ncbi:MAG TPA: hypothetical protein VK498_07825 [Ferruginibacter sp.]|nr:hypothetical protein [Ferruginibacter sp.]
MIYKFVFPVLSFLLLTQAIGAQDCKVTIEALAGKYEGECKNGKADGKGKAVGVDAYEGQFKAGVPNGSGIYTWSNGNFYEGEFSKGLQDGNGTMIYRLPFKDSLVKGYWKKGVYGGRFVKPYLIYARTVHVTNISCKPVNSKFSQVELFLDSETGNQHTSFNSGPVAKPELTNVQLINGRFEKQVLNDQYGKKNGYIFEEVQYPFRAIFTVGNDMFELEFFEGTKWIVDVRLAY